MEKIYRIHPGIGIARVGKSTDGFFLLGDRLQDEPYELNQGGTAGFKGYKDAPPSYQVRKQGARFKIFEYDKDTVTGKETLVGEVSQQQVKITWHVALGNGKAEGPFMDGGAGLQQERVIVPNFAVDRRNSKVADRSALHPVVQAGPINGPNQPFQTVSGNIMGVNIVLGEVGTDYNGNLVVLGGSGEAGSWSQPPAALDDFLNNDGWFDTTADGSVDAELTFPDGRTIKVDYGSWVIIGPPDFAPAILPIVSIWDLMHDSLIRNGRLPKSSPVSFIQHILPVLQRAAEYRWIHNSPVWNRILKLITENDLSDNGDQLKEKRRNAFSLVQANPLSDFKLTPTQMSYFNDWVNGNFVADSPVRPEEQTMPFLMDFSSLTRAIGSGLFPGIELGYIATNANIYEELARFTRQSFLEPDFNITTTLSPGLVIQRMACPWQADFMECAGNWWPAQRPDVSKYKKDGSPASIDWTRGLVVGGTGTKNSHINMVTYFSDLGVIEPIDINSSILYVETGRNPAIPET